MSNHEEQNPMRLAIEAVSNFLKKQKQTETRQLDDHSESKELGDPISDVKMNQQGHELGSDGKNAPTVSVTAGQPKGGIGPDAGQRTAQFHDNTKLVENEEPISERQLRELIVQILQEQMSEMQGQKDTNIKEAAATELLGTPTQEAEKADIDEAGGSHLLGRLSNVKPKKYPDNLER